MEGSRMTIKEANSIVLHYWMTNTMLYRERDNLLCRMVAICKTNIYGDEYTPYRFTVDGQTWFTSKDIEEYEEANNVAREKLERKIIKG